MQRSQRNGGPGRGDRLLRVVTVKRERLPGGCRLWQPSNFSSISIVAIGVKLSCRDFSASLSFDLCGLPGFPRIRGLDKILRETLEEGAMSDASRTSLNFDHSLVTTAFDLAGYKVTRNLGVVRGIVVRSRSLFGTVGASLQTLVGGDITLFTEMCEKTRSDAFERMIAHAIQIGANGVIGVRYDANEIMQGVAEVLAYGTAVVVERA
jgi:uncharacterized protein YbjQ (UPF0145 family)